jgi:translation elongation factor EF-Ts
MVFLISVGASYIHGTEENPLAKLAEAVHSTLIPRHRSDLRIYYDQEGKATTQHESKVIYEKVSQYSDEASLYSRRNVVDKSTSVGNFYDNCITSDPALSTESIRRMVASGLENLSHSAGCDLDQLSLKYYWTDDDLPVILYDACV